MLRFALLCGLLSANLLAHASDSITYNRVDFQAEAARDVANDFMVVNMSAEIQSKQPARVAQLLNSKLNDALKKAAAFRTVKTSSGNQYTRPVYGKNNQVEAWRGHGEIRLESRDFKSAGELVMQLQSSLQLGQVQFTVAPDTRAAIENELITEAIRTFHKRAESIRAAVVAKSYKIVHLSINSSGMPPPFPAPLMRGVTMANVAIPEPEFAGGESRMTAQIQGTIELQ